MNHMENRGCVMRRPGSVSACWRGLRIITLVCSCLLLTRAAHGADVFLRFRVKEPQGEKFRVALSGFRHVGEQWYLPGKTAQVDANAWSEWVDLRDWPLHGRMNREGGLAEWPSIKMTLTRLAPKDPFKGCTFEVQLADKPDEQGIVISFTESSASDSICFLAVHPLREKKDEFETGSQMTERHLRWAQEVVGKKPISLKRFDVCSTLWGHYDPALARKATLTLKLLGFNVLNGAPNDVLREAGMRVLGKTWHYGPDRDGGRDAWRNGDGKRIANQLKTDDGKWFHENMAHLVVADEVKALDFRRVDKAKLNGWFREYLKEKGVTQADLGKPLDQVEYPAEAMVQKTLPREADLPTRRLMYHAAKFGHWWSARQLRQTTDMVKESLPGMKTETLPSSHGFFNAWGPPHMGMSFAMLDLFELGSQESVDVLSSEDWLGLNHMYGPGYTWTGAQSFEYLNAILRSAIGSRNIKLLALITPSDDGYLRLKAYSALGQGAKAFFFWTFGPTYIGTENYWSDLRSEYEGLAKLGRHLEKAEDVLAECKPVSDPVAILYSVSHDIWYSDQPAAFAEKRLLWHALRHLSIQPDFLREEDVEAGRLKGYKVLYVADWCVSRKASEQIDKWVRAGGVLYLSAGAATRDELYEPYVPPYAKDIWPEDAARKLVAEKRSYNERRDLPRLPALTTALCQLKSGQIELPVIGCRLDVLHAPGEREAVGVFKDGPAAWEVRACGQGKVMGVGFMPMLAYGQMADFKPATLEEKWPEGPRRLVAEPCELAGVAPVAKADVPVVETSLLTGPKGSALVLANYTYQPIKELQVDVKLAQPVSKAVSCERGNVPCEKIAGGVRLKLPLEWTDIVLLLKE